MRNFAIFSFSIGAVVGIGMASQILNGSFDVAPVTQGPLVSVASTPLRMSHKIAQVRKPTPAPKQMIRKRVYRKRSRVVQKPVSEAEKPVSKAEQPMSQAEKSISQMVSSGLAN